MKIKDLMSRRLTESRDKTFNLGQLPPGRYVISDPCYVIERKEYERLLDETNFWSGHDEIGGVFTDSRTGADYAVVTTKYGDGSYPATSPSQSTKLSVDAGCIACLPEVMLNKRASNWMNVEFTTPFDVSYSNGTITYGNVNIFTGDEEEYEDEDEDEEDDDF